MNRRFAVVGTAGHIDHGKTALVRRLTGVDTDRLKEEKERGISIDLGFAPLALSPELTAGIVDVPGHERFIRNMLAGVGGIDLVLLVVAADEGIMPQTREHLAILGLLRIPACVCVLTKCDLVESDYAAMVEEEVRQTLSAGCFGDSPIVRFSAVTGQGEPELRAAMLAALGRQPLRDSRGPLRMPVDRVFTMEGFGTVVTGTLWRGTVRVADTVRLAPRGQKLRVRSLETHGQRVEEATGGRRVAVSLHPLAREDARRGDWMLAENAPAAARRASVRVELLPDAPRPMPARWAVRFHLGATESLGIVRLLGGETLEPGGSTTAQIELRQPVVLEKGDRFVIRAASGEATLGGGTVLEAGSPRVRANDSEARAKLERLEHAGPQEQLLQALEGRAAPVKAGELARAMGLEGSSVANALGRLGDEGRAVAVGDGWVAVRRWDAARARILREVQEYEREFPIRFGIGKGELKSRLQRDLAPALFDSALALALGSGALHAREERIADSPALPLDPPAARAAERMLAEAKAAGLKAPSAAELAQSAGPDGQEIVLRLVFERRLTRLPGDLIFDSEAIAGAIARVQDSLARTPRMGVAEFKELFGLSRKYLVPLMEHLDALGVTRRDGDARVAGARRS